MIPAMLLQAGTKLFAPSLFPRQILFSKTVVSRQIE